ncbi:M14 family zinc carboxypeptidase, partial [Flavobacteriaceae bacterium]|nr:M14 family zinc carboxypeptidase [Flavobacteriaceae bacterium]
MIIKEFNYSKIKALGIDERYLSQDQIDQITSRFSSSWKHKTIGYSVEKRPVYSWTWGQGPQKLLMWSQMHGNETTTTRGLLDLMCLLDQDTEWTRQIYSLCTICVIPVLNPDGAHAYTRSNAAGIDLNRDAQDLSQPESILLRSLYEDWSPSFCFNLHDQRTIYNVGNDQVPATMSFLAPAADEQLTVPEHRAKAMQVIVDINEWLQSYIPQGVGRYDDAYNINCVGDTFQTLGTPTILFEAGHYPDDYQRTNTRALVCLSLYTAINSICFDLFVYQDIDQYLAIPQNEKKYVDVLKNIESFGDLIPLIHHSVALKAEVTSEDPTEQGLRKILNFGHTLGHAIESYFLENDPEDCLLHGEAIAVGMIMEAY